jgi:glycosyltransferase involved in cell wall biosynthesis
LTGERAVLQVVPRLVTGGVERGAVEVAAALTAAGWKAIVASEGGPMAAEVTRAGAVHIALPLASKNPYIMWRNVERLSHVIAEHNVGIIHARSRAPAWSAFYAAKRTDRHFVTTFHNAYGANSALKRMYNSVMGRGELVIAISGFVAAYAERVYGVAREKLRMIPRGVDTGRFDSARVEAARVEKLRQEWQIPKGQPVILLPGRLTRWKGQDTFIEAIARLKRRDVTCLIVGSGDAGYRDELARAIRQRGLDGVVRLTDECRDMPAAFRLADIVVSASTRPEGFGRVIVEAQAMGCLVIATEHGGAEETILHGKTGWLIPPRDADKLAEALAKTLALPAAERTSIGERAIAHVRANFTTALMTARTLAVYEEVLRMP